MRKCLGYALSALLLLGLASCGEVKTALTALNKNTLTITQVTGGTITSDPVGSSFTSGTSITLTATPQSGYTFTNWAGSVSGTSNPHRFTLSGDATISAVFTPVSTTVTVNGPYNPTITFAGVPSSAVAVGTAISVSAVVAPTPDSYQWYVDGAPVAGATLSQATLGSGLAAGSHVVTLVVTKGTSQASEDFVYTVESGTATSQGTISGTVNSIVPGGTKTPLSGVTVTLLSGATTLATTTTAADGTYTFSQAVGTGYDLTFTKTGYITTTYAGVSIVLDTTTVLSPVLNILITYSGTGSATGRITDAFTGKALAGATVSAYSGVNNVSGITLSTVTTTSAGGFTFTGLSAGQYTALVTKVGYTSASFSFYILGGNTVSNQNFSVTPTVSSGQVRIVLTWGATPDDLDSHLKTPSSGHLYFSNKGSSIANPYATLDVDDTESYGPETITIYTQEAGDYYYYVHDYSNEDESSSTALASSGATVTVYSGSSLVAKYYVPTGGGTLWKVFKLNGTTLTPINQMLYQSSAGGVSSRRLGPLPMDQDEATFFGHLPRKSF